MSETGGVDPPTPPVQRAVLQTGGVDYKYAVMRFDDRNRYGATGVPSTLLFSGGQTIIVHVKPVRADPHLCHHSRAVAR